MEYHVILRRWRGKANWIVDMLWKTSICFWETWLVSNFNYLVCLVVLDLSISKSKERERLRGQRGRVLVARVTGQIKLTIFVFVSDDGNKNCFGSLCFYFLSLTRLERERWEGAGALLGLAERQEGAKFSIYTLVSFFEPVRFGLTDFCITKSKTKPNRDFF